MLHARSASSGKTLHFPDDMHKLIESSGISAVFPDEMREMNSVVIRDFGRFSGRVVAEAKRDGNFIPSVKNDNKVQKLPEWLKIVIFGEFY